jgi:hypothetical protein
MKILPKQLPFNTLPLFAAARTAELRHPPSTAAKKLIQRYRLSACVAEAIVRANGYGPKDGL